jgi:dTDP-4-amino-4,6-dideoxygalactose transaminase
MTGSKKNLPGVPMLDLKRQYQGIREEVLAAIERVCQSQHFVLGPEVEALEREVAAFAGAGEAVACASGTDALWLALAAVGVGPGDKVITTPFSFFASASSIVRAGAEAVFADVDPKTLNLDLEAVRQAIIAQSHARGRSGKPKRYAASRYPGFSRNARAKSKLTKQHPSAGRIKAILPVHLYGQCADMDALREIAAEHDIVLIEDAAQAIGAKWRGQNAGNIGAAAAFSFYPTKNLSAYGDAGMVTTNNRAMAEHMRRLRNHGSPERYVHTEFGWNARMDAIQAAVLRVKLQHLTDWNNRRRQHAESYDRLLQDAGLVSQKVVTLPHRSEYAFHIFHQYVIRAKRRDDLRQFLTEKGIGSEVYYPIPLHLQPVFSHLDYKKGDLPESEQAAKEVLALPMFPELTEGEQSRVVEAIADFYA